ncbi:hypothetical protein GCM10007855_18570 [Aliivibrio sifiae]|uniref:Uncharacterized protein n=1 Tax=Aliivibrio sifiae TaxID=566293 RepID=A0ABQ6AHW7_9GAMM|nr:hypothetical protein GCM10007855_18570 [Aliivibrio sifiae]
MALILLYLYQMKRGVNFMKLLYLVRKIFGKDNSVKKQALLRERLDFAMSQTKEY